MKVQHRILGPGNIDVLPSSLPFPVCLSPTAGRTTRHGLSSPCPLPVSASAAPTSQRTQCPALALTVLTAVPHTELCGNNEIQTV